jgi:hypothetical protein
MKTLSQQITENMMKVKVTLTKASEHVNAVKCSNLNITVINEHRLASNRLN